MSNAPQNCWFIGVFLVASIINIIILSIKIDCNIICKYRVGWCIQTLITITLMLCVYFPTSRMTELHEHISLFSSVTEFHLYPLRLNVTANDWSFIGYIGQLHVWYIPLKSVVFMCVCAFWRFLLLMATHFCQILLYYPCDPSAKEHL